MRSQQYFAPTLLFQENAALCYHDRDVAVNVALAVVVHQGNGNIRVDYALAQRDTENSLWFGFCRSQYSVRLGMGCSQTGTRRKVMVWYTMRVLGGRLPSLRHSTPPATGPKIGWGVGTRFRRRSQVSKRMPRSPPCTQKHGSRCRALGKNKCNLGREKAEGQADGVARVEGSSPCDSSCLEDSLKFFHQDLRSRLLGGDACEVVGVGGCR